MIYFKLIGSFVFTKDITDLKEVIYKFLNENTKKILTKNGEIGCSINDFKIEKNILTIKFESNQLIRAHEVLIRLKKELSNFTGKKFKIGIRDVLIKYFDIKMESKKSLNIKNLPYVKNIEYGDKCIVILFDTESENKITYSEIEKRIPDRIITLLKNKMNDYGGKNEHWELLWESEDKKFKFKEDPTKVMEKEGWIKRGYNRGQWIYGPQATHLFRTFEKITLKELLEPLGFSEMIFPKLVPWEVWMRSGHAQGVYPEIYYVCPPKTRDPEYWEDVKNIYNITKEIPIDLIENKIDSPIGGMCYAQCPSFWGFLQGETVSIDQLPLKVYDHSGTSHRYESGGIHGIERVDEFHRLELVWLGTRKETLEMAEEIKEKYKNIFENILELKWRTAWVTPWFMAQEGKKGLSDMEGAGTVDYEAITPYNNKWIEFQNLSVNADKYTKGFNVKSQNNKKLWSGCSGIGLERWTAAFISQHGINIENWPDKFKKYFGKLPLGIKTL
ncbi:serine--tRNA ligase [Methanobrevibacter arboriphilus]|jgi:seryl-tRNA synthetase|uniref:Serine--tRNA ligase n=1 Tax=Methanobrevibacter arboriphilus TaxID=39441 RepID=A0ACA8R623_METAZ|nr:serine--tRNA ligase [Methanobrevibacter arboriphilus]BBL62273.1 serine--tRNA ligase [Methanobrevibacter arboriphilus]GLI11465.1 serine--tRNA ligase [Methanobrevibacter arboriphilus]